MPLLVYTNADFQPFTTIRSADVNSKFNSIKAAFNYSSGDATTGLNDANIQSNDVTGGGLTRATKLKKGSPNYVVINSSDGSMTEEQYLNTTRGGTGFGFTPGAGNAGKVLAVKSDGSGMELAVASGGAAGVDLLRNKLSQEQINFAKSEPIDNTVSSSGAFQPASMAFSAIFLQNAVLNDTVVYTAFNPVFLSNSDKDTDSTTGWTAVNAANALTTSATRKIGSTSLSFGKTTGDLYALIQFDNSTQTLAFGSNTNLKFWVNLPSLTGLSSIAVRIYADSTSNYAEFLLTADESGTSLATGWNFMSVDISGTPSSSGGTGWTSSQLARYAAFGVKATTTGTTFSGILLDAIAFSFSPDSQIAFVGEQLTVYDTSNQAEIIIDSTNTKTAGKTTLASGIGFAFSGGSASSAGVIKQSTLLNANDNQFIMDRTGTGSILTKQSFKISRFLRATQAGNFESFFDVYTPQYYDVLTVGASVFTVTDVADDHLDLLSGDTIHIFRKVILDGETTFIHRGDATLTSNSSFSSSVTTLTATGGWPAGSAVGDIAIKKPIQNEKVSLVADGANVNYQALTKKTTPDGVLLVNDSIPYPNRQYVVAHWKLGDRTQAQALKNQVTSGLGDLSANGGVSTSQPFLKGRLAGGGNFANNVNFTIGANSLYTGESLRFTVGLWFNPTAFTGASRGLMTTFQTGGNNGGYEMILASGSNNVVFNNYTTVNTLQFTSTIPFTPNKWNFLSASWLSGSAVGYAQVNGNRTTISSATALNSSSYLSIGGYPAYGSFLPAVGVTMADLIIWSDGPALTVGQVAQMYAGGSYAPAGPLSPMLQYRETITSLSGQKLSQYAELQTSTSSITPSIGKSGTIKS